VSNGAPCKMGQTAGARFVCRMASTYCNSTYNLEVGTTNRSPGGSYLLLLERKRR
jgi:hypothetical protein